MDKIKGFISYAHKDKTYFESLKEGIEEQTSFADKIDWEFWDDEDVRVGDEWHVRIQNAVKDCQFAILLISPSFYNSEYIKKDELGRFLEKVDRDGFLVFPILIRDCRFDEVPIMKDFQHFAPNGDLYGVPEKKHLAYSFLTGPPKSPHIDQYHMDLVEELEKSLAPVLEKRKKVEDAGEQNPDFRKIVPARNITKTDVFQTRRAFHVNEDFYWKERKADTQVLDCLKSGQSFVVVGSPLAGKTRSFYEAVKNMDDVLVVVPNNVKFSEDIDIPRQPGLRTVAFFDDIDRFLKGDRVKDLERLFERLLDEKAIIAATCRSGTEYLTFISNIHSDYRTHLQEIKIEKLSKKEEKEFFTFVERCGISGIDKKAFKEDRDKNIGSFFMGITEMKGRFASLEKELIPQYTNTGKFDVPKTLPGTILTALAHFYYTGRAVEDSAYEIDKIKDFCVRKFKWDSDTAPGKMGNLGLALKEAGVSSRAMCHFNNRQFEDSLEILADRTNEELSFIEVEGACIYIEDVYIEKIIEVRGDVHRILGLLKELYTPEELKSGFLSNIYSFSNFIRKARDLEKGLKLMAQMKKLGVQPNTVTFNSLIPLCKSLEEGFDILEKMEQAKVGADTFTFTSLISLCESLEEGFEILDKMEQAKVGANTVTFNSLIPFCKSLEEGFEILDKMEQAKVGADTVTFTSLIPFCKSLKEGFEILNRMDAEGIGPNVLTFMELQRKTRSREDVEAVEKVREKRSVGKDDIYKRYLGKLHVIYRST